VVLLSQGVVLDKKQGTPLGQVRRRTVEKLLNEQIISQVKDVFDQQLVHPVEVLFFGSQANCDYCEDAHQLVKEVVEISEKLGLRVYDIEKDAAIAQQYHVDKTPGFVFAANENGELIDYGIRVSGVPSGHEFSTLIHDLVLVSGRDSGLPQKVRDELKALTQPVHLQVYVTPT
jgi:alkyl hydroperoxide reductase subunit AhpF